jgi:hypothetical protein
VELLDVTGRRLVAEAAGDLWSKSADGVATCPGDLWSKSADGAALETVGSVALYRGSLDGACCSVEHDEAGGLIWPVPCSCWWLRYGLQNVSGEHANCTAGGVRVNRSWTSS